MFYYLSCCFESDESADSTFSLVGTSKEKLLEIAQTVSDKEHKNILAQFLSVESFTATNDSTYKDFSVLTISYDREDMIEETRITPRT